MFRLFLFYTENFEQKGEEPYLIFATSIDKAVGYFSSAVSANIGEPVHVSLNQKFADATWSNYCDYSTIVEFPNGQSREYGVMLIVRSNIQ